MNDLISRSGLLELAHNHVGGTVDCNDIARFPSVDAEVVRHGRWEAVENTGLEEWCAPQIRCSNCGKTMPDVGADFCPFCGQMNAEVQDEPQD